MFSHIPRWFALSSLLFLGATVLPSWLQGQEPAAYRGGNAAQALTVAGSALPVMAAAPDLNAEASITVLRAAPASVLPPYLALSDPLLAPFGASMPVSASPLAFSMAPIQDDDVHVGANLALIGVGAAALVIGLVLDNDAGTVIAIGGGVVALIGFYRWLR